MPAIGHALTGWWRYSQLRLIPFGTGSGVMLCLWTTTVLGRNLFSLVCAALETTLWLSYLGWGAVNAERARRYGCW